MIRSQQKEYIDGKMGRSIKGALRMILGMAMGKCSGPMVEFIKDYGQMEYKTRRKYLQKGYKDILGALV